MGRNSGSSKHSESSAAYAKPALYRNKKFLVSAAVMAFGGVGVLYAKSKSSTAPKVIESQSAPVKPEIVAEVQTGEAPVSTEPQQEVQASTPWSFSKLKKSAIGTLGVGAVLGGAVLVNKMKSSYDPSRVMVPVETKVPDDQPVRSLSTGGKVAGLATLATAVGGATALCMGKCDNVLNKFKQKDGSGETTTDEEADIQQAAARQQEANEAAKLQEANEAAKLQKAKEETARLQKTEEVQKAEEEAAKLQKAKEEKKAEMAEPAWLKKHKEAALLQEKEDAEVEAYRQQKDIAARKEAYEARQQKANEAERLKEKAKEAAERQQKAEEDKEQNAILERQAREKEPVGEVQVGLVVGAIQEAVGVPVQGDAEMEKEGEKLDGEGEGQKSQVSEKDGEHKDEDVKA